MLLWEIDHLVITASSLDMGVEHVNRALGVTPQVGGEHQSMGKRDRGIGADNAVDLPSEFCQIAGICIGILGIRIETHLQTNLCKVQHPLNYLHIYCDMLFMCIGGTHEQECYIAAG